MMMKPAPIAPFVMTQAEFLFEFPVVALDYPAQFQDRHEFGEGELCGQRRQPVVGRLGFALGPFDDEPFLLPRSIAVRGAHPHVGQKWCLMTCLLKVYVARSFSPVMIRNLSRGTNHSR